MFVNTYEAVQQFKIGRKRKVDKALNLKRGGLFSAKSKAVTAYSDIKLKKKKKIHREDALRKKGQKKRGRKEAKLGFLCPKRSY
jgi:hypothetical protein